MVGVRAQVGLVSAYLVPSLQGLRSLRLDACGQGAPLVDPALQVFLVDP